jgi:type I restriction enzyme S subunit
MKLPPYPKYKASGVEWLGDIPEHWKTKPLGRLVRFRGGATPNKGKPEYWDGEIPWVSPKDMKVQRISDVPDHVSNEAFDNSPLTLIPVQSVLIVVRGMILAHSFPVAIADSQLTINQDMKALIAGREIDPEFLSWLLNGAKSAIVSLAEESAHGTRKLETETISKFLVIVPPRAEQQAITEFLDHETGRISTLITKKRTLIERLKEKRTALISRTVTRGLPPEAAGTAGFDPHPKLKPSGIDWLWDIPEHWEAKRFRYLIHELDQGSSPVAGNSPATDDECGVLKLSAAREGRFIPAENKALEDALDQTTAITPRAGDLLISRANTPERVGDVALVSQDHPHLLIPDLLFRVRVRQSLADPSFLCHFLLSRNARAQIESDARGSSGSMVKLGQNHIRDWLIPCPPLVEQRAISAFLHCQSDKIDQMIETVATAIERLQEYRTSLITAAVTGMIDVRSATRDN